MPKGIYTRTEENKRNISRARIGITWEKRFGKKESERRKRELSKKYSGEGHPLYGKKHSKRTKQKLENSLYSKIRGKKYEEIFGKERAKKIKMNMSKIRKGKLEGEKNPMFGKHLSEEEKIKRRKVAKDFFINHPEIKPLISHFGNKYALGHRHSEETKKIISKHSSMENNPRWLGGLSFEPYDENFNEKFKRMIRKRDNHLCLKCGIHQEKLSGTLTVHHINYDKKLSIPENCCTLCNKCNIGVNLNRPHWTKFFQSLLSERYGYQYSENGEVILNLEENKK